MSDVERCGAEKDGGGRCPSPIGLCLSCGHCWAHCRYGPECDYDADEVQAARARGGKSKHEKEKPDGLEPDDLPPLTGARAAEAWCDVVGRGVVTGRVGHNEANAALRAVREWRESHNSGQMSDRMEQLKDALTEWGKTGDPEPVLELVDGGKS